MGMFKKKKKAESGVQILSAGQGTSSKTLSNDTKKNSTRSLNKSKSFKKKLGSVFRKSGKDPENRITKSKQANVARSPDVNIISPAQTVRTVESEASHYSRPVDLDDGYEIVSEQNGMTPKNLFQSKETGNLLPPAWGNAYEEAVKGIGHVQCSPIDDWNNLVEFFMLPDMKKDVVRLLFGDEDSDDVDTPPVKEIRARPSSPIPFDEREADDPTFYDEQRQLNSLIDEQDEQDDDETVTVQSNQPSIDPSNATSAATYDRTRATTSVDSGSVASTSIVSIPQGESNNSSSKVQQNDTVLSKIIPENSPSATLPNQEAPSQGPEEELYDTSFTLRFLREVTQVGIMLEYFKVTSDSGNADNMKSTLVTISVKPGVSRGSRLLEPRLCWKDMNLAHDSKDEGISISLLGVHSVHTSLSRNDTDDDDSPFFTITTENGDVHAFESPTLSERNYVVHGIKNVVAWLSYHLIMGNMTAGSGILPEQDAEAEESGELPSLRTPVQAMNDLAHSFLD
mmetsp:Transcript_5862/g.6814  ORF Transcript_5862/g.6814 Transcript_5862/m.6814 type:complete len:511 (+) Transcript_5862:135-1667(+)|eukprot:CAMPEP_0198266166 /NCGR_PEP_ID=MMETSP1447-20131203/26899_1 /TAXON_ID=420782 /ORGANISM="Chaetoceros dichaeta, Strain CCMP1751" /LENGTH=510 /DNA_ID=CAMNT_0043956089 /DNA_START=58 /DNA_END=1590 /DNA_ORIENTATION=-